MMKKLLTLGLAALSTVAAFGSTIVESGDNIGTAIAVLSIGSTGPKNSAFVGANIAVDFYSGGPASSNCNLGIVVNDVTCSTAAFKFLLTPKTSTGNSSGWETDNLAAAGNFIHTVTINLLPSGLGAGNAFVGGSLSNFGSGTHISGTGTLTNVVYIPPALAATGTNYAKLILTFADTVFDGGNAYILGSNQVPVVVPEPATYGLVGIALAGLGLVKLRRRKQS